MEKACYRNLKNYKYQLIKSYQIDTGIKGYEINTPFISLNSEGKMRISEKYAWDGPSGPTIDTLNFMRGSLVHDAFYQLIRLELIPFTLRDQTDKLLVKICKEDGMSSFRSWFVYNALKWFGGKAAKPGTEKPDKIICVSIEK